MYIYCPSSNKRVYKEEHRNTKKDLPRQIPWSLPEDGCIKFNVDAARSHRSRSTVIASIMSDIKNKVIRISSKRLADCAILLAECEAVRQATILAVKLPRICIQSDSLIVVNTFNDK